MVFIDAGMGGTRIVIEARGQSLGETSVKWKGHVQYDSSMKKNIILLCTFAMLEAPYCCTSLRAGFKCDAGLSDALCSRMSPTFKLSSAIQCFEYSASNVVM